MLSFVSPFVYTSVKLAKYWRITLKVKLAVWAQRGKDKTRFNYYCRLVAFTVILFALTLIDAFASGLGIGIIAVLATLIFALSYITVV